VGKKQNTILCSINFFFGGGAGKRTVCEKMCEKKIEIRKATDENAEC